MYNGIGITTPRGSGTSGHVVRNASALRLGQEKGVSQSRHPRYSGERPSRGKPMDKGILEHEQKRQVEIKCLELQDKLEEEGLDDDEIEERVDRLRHKLLENIDHLDISGSRGIQSFETQKLAAAKTKANRRMAAALRVEDDYTEGAAFDRELQELKRQKRLLERERDRMAREEAESSKQHHRRRHRSSDAKSKDHRDHKERSRSRSPAKRNIRAVEDGEPGEIEDIEADDSR